MQCEITVKQAHETKAVVIGRVRPDAAISIEDLNQIAQVEQWLEKMTGFRWHILINDI